MDEEIDGSTNEASKDSSASDQIISDVGAPPCEREASSGSNDAHQDKIKECITSPSCFTMDDRSSPIDPLVGTSSKVHNECKYSYFFHLKKRVLFVLGTLYE